MTKLLKILLGLMLILVLLVTGVGMGIFLLVDPNDFRDDIASQVQQATGRTLHIEGPISLSVFPWLGVELKQLSLDQPQGFDAGPLVSVQRAQVRARLMPLLRRRLEMDTLTLAGLRLNLVRNAQGQGNWEDVSRPAAEEGMPDEMPVQRDEHGHSLRNLVIAGIQIRDAQVHWTDHQQGRQVTLRDLNLETGRLAVGNPVDLKFACVVDSQTPALSGQIQVTTTLSATDDFDRLDLDPFELHLEHFRTPLGLALDTLIKARLRFDHGARTLELDGLDVTQRMAGGPLGEITATTQLRGRLAADLEIQRYQAEGLNLAAQLQGGPWPGTIEGRLGVSALLELAKGQGQMGLDLQAAGLHLTGDFTGSQTQGAPRLTGTLAVAELDLQQFLHDLGLPLPVKAETAFKRFALSTSVDTDLSQVGLEHFQVRLDDSRLSGRVWVLLEHQPGYRFALTLDGIDLDHYLPPRHEPSTPRPQQPAVATAESPLFPVNPLRNLDLDGSLRIGHLVLNGLRLEDIWLALKGQGGSLTLKQRVGQFYQGHLDGSLGIAVTGQVPHVQVLQRVKGVQIGPLLQALSGQDRLSGNGDFNLDLNGSGVTMTALKRSLNGHLSFAFTDGAFKGINLGRMLRQAATRLKGKSLALDQEVDATDFSELKGSAVIRDGVLQNEDLSAKSPLFRITGAGQVDLGQGTLDYLLKPVLVATPRGQGGADLEQLKGIPVPVRFTGSLQQPDWHLDLAAALTESQKAGLKDRLEVEIRKQLPSKLQERLPKGLLDGWFQ